MHRRIRGSLAAGSCGLAMLLCPLSSAPAQQAPPPDCKAAEHRAFDFWIGDWTVTDSAGRVVYGTNHVSREEDGCLLHERWTGSRGGSGQSLNFFDRVEHRWEQVWVSSNGAVLRIVGGLRAGQMVLEGEGVNGQGQRVRNRITWTPQSDGRVRQHWQQSSDGGRSWSVAFDGWYRRS